MLQATPASPTTFQVEFKNTKTKYTPEQHFENLQQKNNKIKSHWNPTAANLNFKKTEINKGLKICTVETHHNIGVKYFV